jgi:hypothetical protein
MRFLQKTGPFLCLCLFLLINLQGPVQALPESVGFEVKGELISADLNDVPLIDILNKLKSAKGIWFKAESSQLGEKVSARFQNLPLERGLRRILASQDYCLHFDTTGKLVGISLIKKDMKEVQRGMNYRSPEPPRSMPFTPTMPPYMPSAPTGPLYIPKPNPSVPMPVPMPVPKKVPVPNRIIQPPVSNPTNPNNPPQVVRPVPQPARPIIPMVPEPPDDDDEDPDSEE